MTRSRCTRIVESGKIIRPPSDVRANASVALSRSAADVTCWGTRLKSKLGAIAAADRRKKKSKAVVFELPSSTTRERFGATSFSIASHLPTMLGSIEGVPVMLAPGRATLAMKPGADRIGSVNEHDRDFICFSLERGDDRGCLRDDYVWLQSNQFFSKRLLWEVPEKAFFTGDFGLVGSQTVPRLAD